MTIPYIVGVEESPAQVAVGADYTIPGDAAARRPRNQKSIRKRA